MLEQIKHTTCASETKHTQEEKKHKNLKLGFLSVVLLDERGELTASYRWASWVWEKTGWSWRRLTFREITDRFRGIYGIIYLKVITKALKITTCNRLDFGNTWILTNYAQKPPWTLVRLAYGRCLTWQRTALKVLVCCIHGRKSHKYRDCIVDISLHRWVFMLCGVGNRSTIVPLFSVGCVRVSTVLRLGTRVLSKKNLMSFMHTCTVIPYGI